MKGWGEIVVPNKGSSEILVIPSGRVILNLWMMDVKNKNISCLASASPKHVLLPMGISSMLLNALVICTIS